MIPSQNSKPLLYFFIGLFLLIAGILTFGDSIQRGLAVTNPGNQIDDNPIIQPESQQPPTTPTTPTTQTETPPPVHFQFEDFPPSLRPTALPPGNNVSAPLNSGPDTQVKSGALGVGAFQAGSINSGDVTVNGTIKLKGITLDVGFDNGGEDYYGPITQFDLWYANSFPQSQLFQNFFSRINIDWNAGLIYFYSDPLSVGGQDFKNDTCNSDHENPYSCPTDSSMGNSFCLDIYNSRASFAYIGSGANADRYNYRQVTCSLGQPKLIVH